MNDQLRQIEILAQIRNGVFLSKSDWADKYNVAEITINRDLNALRKMGLGVYSKGGKVELNSNVSEELYLSLLTKYMSYTADKHLMSRKIEASLAKKEEVFSYLILLSKAIREQYKININYRRFYDNKIGNYILKSVTIEVEGLNWTLNAIKEGEKILKTFYIQRIKSLQLTEHKYRLPLGFSRTQEVFDIVLKFHPSVKEHICDKIWFDVLEINTDKEGFTFLKTRQPITNRLSAWCITWRDAIEIIEPKELKEHALEMIKKFKIINK